MKKGLVALLLVLAVIVLVSPGIVGRLAEQSMDENLDWAATESQDVTVTSQGFDRGWFSSEGQHRVEVRGGELHDFLVAFAAEQDVDGLPVLIIDTRLDHGLVPLSSMTRDKGSLLPGLGNAVSTLSLEFDDGERIDLPGTVYSSVGLTGNLQSNLVLEPGSFSEDGATTSWGDVDIRVTMSPTSRVVGFSGTIDSLLGSSIDYDADIRDFEFSGNQQQTEFGISVGDLKFSLASATFPSAQGAQTIGPISVDSFAELEGNRVSGRSTLQLDHLPFGELGSARINIDARVKGLDGESLGRIARTMDEVGAYGTGNVMLRSIEADLQQLLAAGFELHLERVDVTLPQGTMRTRLNVEVAESDIDGFAWTSALLALNAAMELSVPVDLMEVATAVDPQLNAAIAMGFLRRNGDVYEMEAAFKKGLLTVNGAPMPIPVPGLQ